MEKEINKEEEVPSQEEAINDLYGTYRASFNIIPKNTRLVKDSNIPMVLNVIPQNAEEYGIAQANEEIIRCMHCKSYLNPFVEIIPPGLQWKCNLCYTINHSTHPFHQIHPNSAFNQTKYFDPFANACYNTQHYTNPQLINGIIELSASSNYVLRTPPPPHICFLIESTYEGMKNQTFQTILKAITENLECIPNDNNRTKIMLGFFDSCLHLLKKDNGMLIISDFEYVPMIYPEDLFFEVEEIVNLEIENIIKIFETRKSTANDLGGALATISTILAKTGGSLYVFLSTLPNQGKGNITGKDVSIKSKNPFYKELAGELSKNMICVSYFLFPRNNIDLPTLSVLSRFTGGTLNYYPNFDGSDPTFSTKLVSDLSNFLELNVGFDAVSRVRVSKGVRIKEYFGNFHLKQPDLLSFANYIPSHSLTFKLEFQEESIESFCVQIAVLKSNSNGERKIRVINIAIPVDQSSTVASFYDSLDIRALVHYLAIQAANHEFNNSGIKYLNSALRKIVQGYKDLYSLSTPGISLPPSLQALPTLILALSKSIPLRPSKYTPADYKIYYIYLFTTSYPKLVDTIIYPTLIALHQSSESIPLSLNYLETNGFYLLDTGINTFFFVGRDCEEELPGLLFDPSTPSGRVLLSNPGNEFSNWVFAILGKLRKGRFVSPNYILIRDAQCDNVYRDIFFSYFIEDANHSLPSLADYIKKLGNEIS
ncbi:Protein transport protein SEC24 [Astathelohania contejeani]|uniref:Protein transport protein SEC24 n=1 Tax=Astathelohania contejeani TaxID=164912 RepID=A0ABQ7HXT7_9MICR|nr:Protein transport protein SEC24 [Thelohania contejeani]